MLWLKLCICLLLLGMQTYDGMIVGEHSRDTDLDVRKGGRIFCAFHVMDCVLFRWLSLLGFSCYRSIQQGLKNLLMSVLLARTKMWNCLLLDLYVFVSTFLLNFFFLAILSIGCYMYHLAIHLGRKCFIALHKKCDIRTTMD